MIYAVNDFRLGVFDMLWYLWLCFLNDVIVFIRIVFFNYPGFSLKKHGYRRLLLFLSILLYTFLLSSPFFVNFDTVLRPILRADMKTENSISFFLFFILKHKNFREEVTNALLASLMGCANQKLFYSLFEEKGFDFSWGEFVTDDLKPPHLIAVLLSHEGLPPVKALAFLVEVLR